MDNTIKETLNSAPLEFLIKRKSFTVHFYNDISQQKIEELLKSYNENNSVSAVIKEKLKIKYNYAIISQYELNKLLIFGKKLYDEMPEKPVDELHSPMVIWKPFLSQYQTDSCYSLSRVAFSKDKKIALVLFSRSQGIMGDDMFYVLEKVGEKRMNPKWFGIGSLWNI